jgi:hypothetical protein
MRFRRKELSGWRLMQRLSEHPASFGKPPGVIKLRDLIEEQRPIYAESRKKALKAKRAEAGSDADKA